jgi:murein DD-endopeptidase MepM/ murein hydrolase activator NlpD
MRRSLKVGLLSAFLLAYLLFGSAFLSWSSAAAQYYYVCTLTQATVSYTSSDGAQGSTTSAYLDCYYVPVYDFGYGGGGGGGGGFPNPDEQDPTGGGGGSTQTYSSVYDTNKDGYIDCYKKVMRISNLTITSGCAVVRPDGKIHKAWDLAGSSTDTEGADIYSVSNGEVIDVGTEWTDNAHTEMKGWGRYAKIKDTSGNIWIYGHLDGTSADPSGIGLTVGTKVVAGDTKIGLCDSTGTSSADHLHLEYWVGSVKTCPSTKLSTSNTSGNC